MSCLSRFSSKARGKIIRNISYNAGLLPSQLVYIDLSTDSLMHFILPQKRSKSKNDIECSSHNLTETIKRYFGYNYTVPVAQGRMAELILAKILVKNSMAVPNNMLFVTTRFHQELNGATLEEIPIAEAYDLKNNHPFKGNIDTKKLEEIILDYGAFWVAYIYVETCVNASGGHPVSMANIKDVNSIAKKYNIPVILDACRILENAYLIKEREDGYSRKSVSEIVKEFCSYSDGCTMSLTKDFQVDAGGAILVNKQELYYQLKDASMIIGEGLSMRSKAAMNDVINQTARDESAVRERIEKGLLLWTELKKSGVPVVNPCGGHGVFIDVKDLYAVLPAQFYPEESFLANLYVNSGIRAGSNILTPQQEKYGIKMLRLAIPTSMYSKSQMSYVAKSFTSTWGKKEEIKGLRKTFQPPSLSGSFFSKYEIIEK